MHLEDYDGVPVLNISGREIDQVLSIASAVRALPTGGLLHRGIQIEGLYRQGPDQERQWMHEFENVQIVGVNAWGYIRTILANVVINGESRTITIGGENAVVEDLALKAIRFRSESNLEDLRHRLFAVDDTDLDLDLEFPIVRAELDGRLDLALEYLNQIVDYIRMDPPPMEMAEKTRQQIAVRLLSHRLSCLSIYMDEDDSRVRDVERLVSTVCDLAADLFNPTFRMYLCEAVWFWERLISDVPSIRAPIERTLLYCREDQDINVRLAAIVSRARLEIGAESLGIDLCNIIADALRYDSPHLRAIRALAMELRRTSADLFASEELEAVELLLLLADDGLGPKQRSKRLCDRLDEILADDFPEPSRGPALESLTLVLLVLSRLFRLRREVPQGPGHRTDILATLDRNSPILPKLSRLRDLPHDFEIVFECRNKSRGVTNKDVQDLTAYCERKQSKWGGRRLGVLVTTTMNKAGIHHIAEVSNSPEKEYYFIGRRKLRKICADVGELQRILEDGSLYNE